MNISNISNTTNATSKSLNGFHRGAVRGNFISSIFRTHARSLNPQRLTRPSTWTVSLAGPSICGMYHTLARRQHHGNYLSSKRIYSFHATVQLESSNGATEIVSRKHIRGATPC